jgi:hypothetical protein
MKQLYKMIFEKNKRITAIAGTIGIVIVIAAVFSIEASGIETKNAKDVLEELRRNAGVASSGESERLDTTLNFNGNGDEHTESTEEFELIDMILSEIVLTLTWTDEDMGLARSNEPDEFSITLTTPSGDSESSPFVPNRAGDLTGQIVLPMTLDENEDNTGIWQVTISTGECGDVYTGGPFGLIKLEDDIGNSWALSIQYFYYSL